MVLSMWFKTNRGGVKVTEKKHLPFFLREEETKYRRRKDVEKETVEGEGQVNR